MSGERAVTGRARRRLTGLTPRLGAGALAVTQAADVLTTLYALRYVSGLEEANAVAAAAIAAFGPVAGLTLLSALAVGAMVLVTELGAAAVRDGADGDGAAVLVGVVRLLGYGPVTVLNVLVVLHNAMLIGAACCRG